MSDKREWYQAQYFHTFLDGESMWLDFRIPTTLSSAQRSIAEADFCCKTRIVRHTTEVVEEREATQ